MTVIAYDGKTLAADTKVTANYSTLKAQKIFWLVGKYELVAFSGEQRLWAAARDWLKKGESKEDCPFVSTECGFEMVAIAENGKMLKWSDGSHLPVPVEAPFAMGSGSNFAMGAMCAGASAEEAVLIASKLDPYSGGSVKSKTLSKNQR